MKTYIARGISFRKLALEIIAEVLSCPTINRIVFPARMTRPDRGPDRLLSAESFDLAMARKYHAGETLMRVPLHGENGIDFVITIGLDDALTTHNSFNLCFSQNHIQRGIVDFTVLESLLVEVIPVFGIEHFTVFSYREEGQSTYFSGPDHTYYPIELGWMTYFGKGLVEFLTPERFGGLKAYKIARTDLHSGILITFSNDPFDPDAPAYWKHEAEAISELGLEKLVPKRW